MNRLLPGERVLWQGRPRWRAVARDVLHIRLVALYLAAAVVWGAADDRTNGLPPVRIAFAAVPAMLLGLLVLGALAGFAWAVARTTRYTVTTERCVMEFGVALTATVSVPWRRVAAVSLAVAGDGTGSIPLTLKPGPGVSALKLWPHVRLRRAGLGLVRPEPMLRGVPNAARVGDLVAQAVRSVSPGRVTAAPAPDAEKAAAGLVSARAEAVATGGSG